MATIVLLRVFVRSFYRRHVGLFLFVFLFLFGIIDPSQWYSYQKNLMLGFIAQPAFQATIFVIWLAYVIKALHHIKSLLFARQQEFLFYSITSLSSSRQFKSWCTACLVIMLPVAVYGVLAAFTAFYYQYYLASIGILLYLVFLVLGAAYICTWFVNRLIAGGGHSFSFKIMKNWRKPLFSLYIYHVFSGLKIPLFVTKICSCLIIAAIFSLFARESADLRVGAICVLMIVVAHAVLIYEEHRFEHDYMSFARNMPYSRYKFFLDFVRIYLILLLPEGVWLFIRFDPAAAARLYLLALSFALLFHAIIYKLGLRMAKYLRWLFAVFFVVFFLLLFGFVSAVTAINLAVAFMIFHQLYNRAA